MEVFHYESVESLWNGLYYTSDFIDPDKLTEQYSREESNSHEREDSVQRVTHLFQQVDLHWYFGSHKQANCRFESDSTG